ncbi:helix-turn-helix transcriptional regulator [Polymorphospora rubra]|uniref:Excisionase n=1 Tax=Polymorphospora rubra TaxID=338584 RepID=A0A810MVM6_9ACTN|nr:helix-turn-helix domain-containing protein [Polymorphospora rubra]BCJ64604.1 excisionase [Polymorphospora rubra]
MGAGDSLLTVPEVLEELRVPRSTWYLWRQTGRAPRVFKLPNGELRVRRSVLEAWLTDLESEAA